MAAVARSDRLVGIRLSTASAAAAVGPECVPSLEALLRCHLPASTGDHDAWHRVRPAPHVESTIRLGSGRGATLALQRRLARRNERRSGQDDGHARGDHRGDRQRGHEHGLKRSLKRRAVAERRSDAVVVGAGPNGLSAAITLARAGVSVVVLEAEDSVGGGARSAELTLPGFIHDLCSAVYPFGVASPFFRQLPLEKHGLEWVHPPTPLVHPLDNGTACTLERSVDATAASLDDVDARAYRKLMDPLVEDAERLTEGILAPLLPPRHPVSMARFGLRALRSAAGLARALFEGERARALLAGAAGHSLLPMETSPTGGFGLVFALLGHTVGWPIAKGGAQKITDALHSHLISLGGEVVTGQRVKSLSELPSARAFLLDVTARQLAELGGDRLPARYRARLERYRYGPGAFKLDWALNDPIPWAAEECRRAGTVHVGGTLEEISESERTVARGGHPEKPFVIVAQQSLFDPTRAPSGQHTAWAYCHVPNGSGFDMSDRVEAQIERFAPGFRDRVLARTVTRPPDLERRNANLVGGDINGGAQDLTQLFMRPVARLVPYSTPLPDTYICSSSSPPGGGVHGMCGHLAARLALRRVFGRPPSTP